MQSLRQKNTSAESALRRELHARGLRYSIQVPVITKPGMVADVAFSVLRVAVFVDGCVWHGCPLHATWPGDDLQKARRSDRGRRDRFPPSRRSEAESLRAFRAARWRMEAKSSRLWTSIHANFLIQGRGISSRSPRDRKPAFLGDRFHEQAAMKLVRPGRTSR
jgi:DNA mismatch endonuclease (patch repair protein)